MRRGRSSGRGGQRAYADNERRKERRPYSPEDRRARGSMPCPHGTDRDIGYGASQHSLDLDQRGYDERNSRRQDCYNSGGREYDGRSSRGQDRYYPEESKRQDRYYSDGRGYDGGNRRGEDRYYPEESKGQDRYYTGSRDYDGRNRSGQDCYNRDGGHSNNPRCRNHDQSDRHRGPTGTDYRDSGRSYGNSPERYDHRHNIPQRHRDGRQNRERHSPGRRDARYRESERCSPDRRDSEDYRSNYNDERRPHYHDSPRYDSDRDTGRRSEHRREADEEYMGGGSRNERRYQPQRQERRSHEQVETDKNRKDGQVSGGPTYVNVYLAPPEKQESPKLHLAETNQALYSNPNITPWSPPPTYPPPMCPQPPPMFPANLLPVNPLPAASLPAPLMRPILGHTNPILPAGYGSPSLPIGIPAEVRGSKHNLPSNNSGKNAKLKGSGGKDNFRGSRQNLHQPTGNDPRENTKQKGSGGKGNFRGSRQNLHQPSSNDPRENTKPKGTFRKDGIRGSKQNLHQPSCNDSRRSSVSMGTGEKYSGQISPREQHDSENATEGFNTGETQLGRENTSQNRKRTKRQGSGKISSDKTSVKSGHVSTLYLAFKNKCDNSFNYKAYLDERTESLKNTEFSLEGYKDVGKDRVFIASLPSKAASVRMIKLFRKTNCSSEIEVLCYTQGNLPEHLSFLKTAFDTRTTSREEQAPGQKQPRGKKKKKGGGKESLDVVKQQKQQQQQQCEQQTDVYIVIHDTVKRQDVEGFLKARIALEGLELFNITEFKVNDEAKKTQITVQVPSEQTALKIMWQIENSNVDSQTSISCSLTAHGDMTYTKTEIVEDTLSDMEARSVQQLEKHHIKTQAVESAIKEIVLKQNISVTEYNRRIQQKSALEDKLEELNLQKREYCEFLKCLKVEVTSNLSNEDFIKQKKLFGIETCRLSAALPIYARRTDILECVKHNQVTIIRGETGSGKSTQLIQYLYEELRGDKKFVCTQPRKVACVSLADRVANEMLVPLGQDVGYKTGNRHRTSKRTKIVFMTHHCLLNESLKDPLFTAYSCIMIDEAHERSIYTDLLLSIVKKCLPERKDLRIIIASATIDIKVFSDYFQDSDSKCLQIAGRTFPVEEIWLSDEEEANVESYQDEAVKLALKIHHDHGEGDILVFMTTPLETEKCKESLVKELGDRKDFECFTLHGQLHADEQQAVFKSLQSGTRKIVFATNTAETSVTIPGIKYVIDTGLAKEMIFDPKRSINKLVVEKISRSSAEQRKGRAGRTSAGKCFRLYSHQTFKDMRSVNTPEILKVHLGQVMLKLLELSVNPKECDFVESPSSDAIESALQSLKDLKAIDGDKITETGRWLANFPFEPRLGNIVKLGHEKGLVYDALVLASIISSGSSLFYRAGTEEEKKHLDKLKTEFCDFRGDCFSSLNVYKSWLSQPEKKKNKWCFDNGINSKAIRGARDTVVEVLDVMKKELCIEVKKEFSDDGNSAEILQKIILLSFPNNIGHYMGHDKIGYYVPSLEQQVFLHPSSVLKTVGENSQWVVFNSILQTSSYFIASVTPVKEEWVLDVVKEHNLFDIDLIKNKEVSNIHSEYFGPTSFSLFVGPRYTKLKEYEEILADKCGSVVMLDANRDLGEVRVYSSSFPPAAETAIHEFSTEARRALENRSMEYKLGSRNCKTGGVRIVLGTGGEGNLLLMPSEYRTVFITKPNSLTTTKEGIMDKFSKFGDIVNCWEDKHAGQRWGRITFSTSAEAMEAVRTTKDDDKEVAVPEFKPVENHESMFKVKMTWTRRRPKGMAFVNIDELSLAKALSLGSIYILEKIVTLSLDKKTATSLCLKNLPLTADKKDVEEAVYRAMHYTTEEEKRNIKQVTIVREKAFTSTSAMIDTMKRQIEERIAGVIGNRDFIVEVIKPRKDGDIIYRANVKFSRANDGMVACRRLDGLLNIGNEFVSMCPDISSHTSVSKHVYDLLKTTVEEALEAMDGLDFRCHMKETDTKRVLINLYSTKPDDLAKVRAVLDGILSGEVMECWRNENYRYLFLEAGKKFIRQIESKTSTSIHVDERQYTITVYGTTANFTRAQSEIQNYLNEILMGNGKEIDLKAPDQPKGLMNNLIKKWGINLDDLVNECGLEAAALQHKKQILKLSGNSENIEKAVLKIGMVKEQLVQHQQKFGGRGGQEYPDCCACLCPVEDISQLYRLEYCGHAYCVDCFGRQITVAIQNKDLPVLCCQVDCKRPLIWNDFTNSFKKARINPKALLGAAVSKFMMKSDRQSYRHCPTADCSIIYRCTTDGSLFVCYECGIRICTTCHVEYHDGVSCEQYEESKRDKVEVEKYLQEHRNSTKPCPGCKILIEKNHGCNKMKCTSCGVAFCWICLASFKDSELCYEHLSKVHGGIANMDDLLYN